MWYVFHFTPVSIKSLFYKASIVSILILLTTTKITFYKDTKIKNCLCDQKKTEKNEKCFKIYKKSNHIEAKIPF